jgi:hypothetical protein
VRKERPGSDGVVGGTAGALGIEVARVGLRQHSGGRFLTAEDIGGGGKQGESSCGAGEARGGR